MFRLSDHAAVVARRIRRWKLANVKLISVFSITELFSSIREEKYNVIKTRDVAPLMAKAV